MARICTITWLLSCCCGFAAYGQELVKHQVIAFDQNTAKLLPPQMVIGVLVHDHRETYDTINARALAMRHATHFVYQSGPDSTLAGMYRERLQTQGIVAIDVRPQLKRRHAKVDLAATGPHLVSLLEGSLHRGAPAQ